MSKSSRAENASAGEDAAAPAADASPLRDADGAAPALEGRVSPGVEASGEGAGGGGDDVEEEDLDEEEEEEGSQYVVLKFLLSTEAAGSIIGKNGVTVGELQAQSGTKIQLSKSREFFPGTSERMMLLCGSMSSVLVALHLVLSKLMADSINMLTCQGQASGTEEVSQLAMVVPHRLCGGIIGRGGATIHSFMDDSGAQLSVSPHNDATGFGERIIYITGAREAQLRAVALVATKMCEDRRYRTDEVPLSYPSEGILYATSHAGLPFMAAAAAPCHPAGQHLGDTGQGAHDGSSSSSGSEWALEMRARFLLPEEAIGVVIGKQGRTIQSIRHRSGARIKIEDGHGSGQRLLVLTGTPQAVVTADALVVAHLRQQGKEAALRRLGDKELAGHEQENVSQAEEGITTDPSSVQAKIGDLSIDK